MNIARKKKLYNGMLISKIVSTGYCLLNKCAFLKM